MAVIQSIVARRDVQLCVTATVSLGLCLTSLRVKLTSPLIETSIWEMKLAHVAVGRQVRMLSGPNDFAEVALLRQGLDACMPASLLDCDSLDHNGKCGVYRINTCVSQPPLGSKDYWTGT